MRLALFVLLLTAVTVCGLVVTHDRGNWPENWPAELEPLRAQARTTEWATGSQEDSHQIPFTSRAQFETYWPVFRKMLEPGAVVRLRSPEKEASVVQDLTQPYVVIHAPPADVSLGGDGVTIRNGFEWPQSAYLDNGMLPEYVVEKTVDGEKRWVPLREGDERVGFQFRARIDLTLVCDGKVVDLNRIRFPEGVTIVDKRENLHE